ncbi:MAG: hypothetical protein AAGD14_01270 [Planctomycetota bacterium]
MIRNFGTILLGIGLLLGEAPAEDAQLVFEVRRKDTTVSLQPKEGEAPAKPVETRLRVRLRADDVSTLDLKTGRETLVDWKNERILDFDHAGKRVRSRSLLAWMAGMRQEQDNRTRIAGALKAGDIRTKAFEPFWIESLFRAGSIRSDAIQEIAAGGAQTIKYKDELVLNAVEGMTPIPEELRQAWKRFLVRELPIHAAVLYRLLKLKHQPMEIRCRFYNATRKTDRVLEFRPWPPEKGEAPPADVDLAAAQRTYAAWVNPKDPLDVLLDDIAAKRIEGKALTRQDYEERVSALAKEGKSLDAFLVLLEGTFAHADLDARTLVATIHMQAPEIQKLTQAMAQLSSEPAVGEKVLLELDREDLEGRATLKILRANARTGQRKPGDARALFLEVLRARPWLAGPTKDLGDLYYMRYQVPSAWRCWERAYALAPKHPLIQPFLRYRDSVRSAYADWLKP